MDRRAWALGAGSLLALLFGPLLLFPTPLSKLAEAWAGVLLLAFWTYLAATFIGLMARAGTPPLALLERGLRSWVARFSKNPEALWLRWARHAHHPDQAWWCLGRAVRLGGTDAIFQEGLAYLEGGLGAGGTIDGVRRLAEAARRGHPEAAFRFAEALRTGQGTAADPGEAMAWYRQSAQAGFGPAAAWLARAFATGDGVAADPEEARRWSAAALRLLPHPPLSRSPLRHDAAPGDPLVHLGGRIAGRVEAAAGRAVAHRAGRWTLLLGVILLGGLALVTVGAFFWAGSSALHHLPLIMLAPPLLLLGWQAWRLRREGPARRRDRLREAAEAGDLEACFRLGQAFLRGDAHRPKDDLSAVLWFRKAAEGGHRGAMRALAEAYRGGHGVVRDPRAAARWEAAAGH